MTSLMPSSMTSSEPSLMTCLMPSLMPSFQPSSMSSLMTHSYACLLLSKGTGSTNHRAHGPCIYGHKSTATSNFDMLMWHTLRHPHDGDPVGTTVCHRCYNRIVKSISQEPHKLLAPSMALTFTPRPNGAGLAPPLTSRSPLLETLLSTPGRGEGREGSPSEITHPPSTPDVD